MKQKTSKLSPTFCVLPWIHQATRTWGVLTPCCVGHPLGEDLNETTFSSAWNSSSIRKLRKTMLQGKKSPLCDRCYKEDKVGIPSYRMRSNEYWKNHYSFDKLIEKTDEKGFFSEPAVYLDLRLGNKCNLECTMCGPQESIRWEKLSENLSKQADTFFLRHFFKVKKNLTHFKSSKLWYEREEIKQDIYKKIPVLKQVTLAGGEPLLIKEHHNFLDECINQKEAHHISLHYHTNGTALSSQLFDKWKHFESVRLFISLDDIGERNYYIRYPCLWSKIENNLKFIDEESPDNVCLTILCTIQAKNIFYFEDFLNYFMENSFKKLEGFCDEFIHTEVVHHPFFLSCQILPKKMKERVSERFENIYKNIPLKTDRFKKIVDFMNAKNKNYCLPLFKDYVRTLDRTRGTQFSKTFPELSKMLEKM